MATTLENFLSETQLSTSEATLISTSSTEKRFIGNVTVTNTSAINVDVTFWRIASAGTGTTGSGGNWIINQTIPAGATVRMDKIISHSLGPSMKISGKASVAAVINVDASGTLVTG